VGSYLSQELEDVIDVECCSKPLECTERLVELDISSIRLAQDTRDKRERNLRWHLSIYMLYRNYIRELTNKVYDVMLQKAKLNPSLGLA